MFKMHGSQGTLHLPSTQLPELLRPGKDTKCTTQQGLCPCRAPWSLSGVTQEAHAALGFGKPSVVHPLQAIPTHASDICLQCPSLHTTQLNK